MINFISNLFNNIKDAFETEYSADVAAKKTDKIRKANAKHELLEIYEKIDCAIKRGEFDISYNIKYEENKDILIKRGYSIFDGYYCRISWKDKCEGKRDD